MAFATIDDLEVRLQRTFPAAAQPVALLEDATGYLQDVIGQLVEAGSATFTARIRAGQCRIPLPQQPVRAVSAVTAEGSPVAFELVDGHVELSTPFGCDTSASITFDYGYAEVPTRLRALAITLASGVLAQIERSGAMTSGNVESERVDDYAVNYAAGADAFVGSLPPVEEERLRAQYGASAYVTGSRG